MGFRALKKTLEALYTTKVNIRVHTSRGTKAYCQSKCMRTDRIPLESLVYVYSVAAMAAGAADAVTCEL